MSCSSTDETCPICFNVYDEADYGNMHYKAYFPCKHSCCFSCFMVIAFSDNSSCMVCRYQLPVPAEAQAEYIGDDQPLDAPEPPFGNFDDFFNQNNNDHNVVQQINLVEEEEEEEEEEEPVHPVVGNKRRKYEAFYRENEERYVPSDFSDNEENDENVHVATNILTRLRKTRSQAASQVDDVNDEIIDLTN